MKANRSSASTSMMHTISQIFFPDLVTQRPDVTAVLSLPIRSLSLFCTFSGAAASRLTISSSSTTESIPPRVTALKSDDLIKPTFTMEHRIAIKSNNDIYFLCIKDSVLILNRLLSAFKDIHKLFAGYRLFFIEIFGDLIKFLSILFQKIICFLMFSFYECDYLRIDLCRSRFAA